ncbi:MAG: hypothetical protein P8123_05550, partial [bacterium]
PTTLDPDTCYAFLYQNSESDKNQEIYVVGKAAKGNECHNRISGYGDATYRYSLAGYGYLAPETLDSSHLIEDGFTGNALRGFSDKLFPFDFATQSFAGYAWHDGAAWQYYNTDPFVLDPGGSYLIYNRNSVDDWIWTVSMPSGLPTSTPTPTPTPTIGDLLVQIGSIYVVKGLSNAGTADDSTMPKEACMGWAADLDYLGYSVGSWRLPARVELENICANKDMLGGYDTNYYFTSEVCGEECGEGSIGDRYVRDFGDCGEDFFGGVESRVRAVRDDI